MKFSAIAKGMKARKRGVECTTLDGTAFTCDQRVLNAEEEARCLAAACKGARDAGGEPVETDLNYQLAFAAHVVALGCVDPDSPDDAPVAYFDGGVSQVRENLDRDRILLLAETHRRFQEQASPTPHELSTEQFVAMVVACAAAEEGEDLPLDRLPRFTRSSFVRSLARMHVILQTDKSSTSSGEDGRATD